IRSTEISFEQASREEVEVLLMKANPRSGPLEEALHVSNRYGDAAPVAVDHSQCCERMAAVMPPSPGKTTPVIHEALSNARNRIADAMSLGMPSRPSNVLFAASSLNVSLVAVSTS